MMLKENTGSHAGFSRAITIDHTKVPNTDQANFPVLISGTYSWLADVAHGGKAVNGNSGNDITFSSSPYSVGLLNFEVTYYNANTGEIEAWVKCNLTTAADLTIYCNYGDASLTTFQGNVAGTWNSNYKAVYHLKDGSSLNLSDVTSNANGMSNINTATATTGQIGKGALSLVHASSQYLSTTGNTAIITSYPLTITGWFNVANTSGSYTIAGLSQTATGSGRKLLYVNAGTLKLYAQSDAGASAFPATTTTYSANTWYYGAAVFASATDFKIYQNGGNVGTSSTNVAFGTPAFTFIGRDSDIPNSYFDGKIDEVHFLSTALSADWIATEYNNQSSPSTFYSVGSEI